MDGGTGTELEHRGVIMDPAAWSGTAALDAYDALVDIHCDFIRAGARIITANTFAASPLMLGHAGVIHLSDQVNSTAVAAAQQARDQMGDSTVIVAGSISHMLPVQAGTAATAQHTEEQLDALSASARAQAHVLIQSGVEVIICEMMYDPERARAVLAGITDVADELWFMISARRGADGSVVSFDQTNEVALDGILAVLAEYRDRVSVSGVMHTDVGITGDALAMVSDVCDGPLAAYPDSGYFEMPHWNFRDVIAPDALAAYARQWAEQGVAIIGGCCGLGPSHIAAIASAINPC